MFVKRFTMFYKYFTLVKHPICFGVWMHISQFPTTYCEKFYWDISFQVCLWIYTKSPKKKSENCFSKSLAWIWLRNRGLLVNSLCMKINCVSPANVCFNIFLNLYKMIFLIFLIPFEIKGVTVKKAYQIITQLNNKLCYHLNYR